MLRKASPIYVELIRLEKENNKLQKFFKSIKQTATFSPDASTAMSEVDNALWKLQQ